jgi:hypothetical protein
MILGQVVPALGAIDVRNLHTAEAPPADRSHLELALRTEVVTRRNLRPAMRAGTQDGLPQHEVHNRSDAARHKDHNQHPQGSRHLAAFDVAADITNQ